MRQVVWLVLAALVGVGCGVLGGDEEDVMAVWDLRETRSIEAVGWPDDAGSSFEANTDQGLERILLPGGVVVEGRFRINPSRRGGMRGQPYASKVKDVLVTFERESVDDVLERARGYADQLGVDLGDIPAWTAANADGQDLSPGGATALSGRTELGPSGPSAQLETRAFPTGGGLLRLLVTWPREEDQDE